MTVYGEYLFLENFITGCVILMLTGKICGRKISRRRTVLGGILCGGYAFVLFVPMGWTAAILGKLTFSLGVIFEGFGFKTKKAFVKMVAIFYLISFLMGGVTVALMYLVKMPGVTANGAVYLHKVTYLQISSGVLVTYVLGTWFAQFIGEKRHKEQVFTRMKVEIEDKQWELQAFVDTGNFLRDPVSGRPAAVLSATCGKKILSEFQGQGVLDQRHCIIPYRSIGENGIMEGIRPDRVFVGGKQVRKIVLAISKEDFAYWQGEEPYEVLLQHRIIEEGALENAK
ncbi:MAG: sigma-E processing peptidase SpoIIGA [Anaerovoracaceae bacterium]